MNEPTDEELSEDFGASVTVADCERLLDRARRTGDGELRLLARQYLALRRTARDALAYVGERYGERAVAVSVGHGATSYPLGFLRFLVEEPPGVD